MAIVIVDSEREWYVPFEREMEREGYKVHFPRYEELMAHLEMAEGSDLIVIGSGVSAAQRLNLCLQLRWASIETPVIVTVAPYSEQEAVAILDAGADYYLPGPVCARELLARVHALLRRSRPRARKAANRIGSSPVHLSVI